MLPAVIVPAWVERARRAPVFAPKTDATRCEWCGKLLWYGSRKGRKHCSSTCKVAAWRNRKRLVR